MTAAEKLLEPTDEAEDLPLTDDVHRLARCLAAILIADLTNHPTLDESTDHDAR